MTKKKPALRLGDLQYRIMEVLWREGEATVGDVHGALSREYAYTTIATMLQKMDVRGLVARRMEGRRGIYKPLVQEGDARGSMIEDLVERVFHGNVEEMVEHLLEQRDVGKDELGLLARIIAEHKKKQGGA